MNEKTPFLVLFLVAAASFAVLALAAPATAAVTTQWLGPTQVDRGSYAYDPAVAMNSNGSGVAAWWDVDGASAALYAGGSWGFPTRLSLDHEFAYRVHPPVSAIDNAGRAIVCWLLHYRDSTNFTEWGESYAALYDPLTGWASEYLVGPADLGWGDTPSCAIGVGGRAFVTFLDSSDPFTTYERLATWTSGSGWTTSELGSSASGNLSAYAKVAADEQEAAVGWNVLNDTYRTPWVVGATYTVAGGWEPNYTMDGGGGGTGLFDVDVTGGVARFLLLGQGESANHTVVLYSSSAGGTWTGPVTVGGPGPLLLGGLLSADPSGDVTVTWTSQPNGSTRNYWGRYFGFRTGWDNATLLGPYDGMVQTRALAPDVNGGALSAFILDRLGTSTVYWVRYVPGAGWRTAESIHATTQPMGTINLVSSPEKALIVWHEWDGVIHNHVRAYVLQRDDTPPVFTLTSPPSLLVNRSTVVFGGHGDPLWRMSFEQTRVSWTVGGDWSYSLTLADGNYSYLLFALDDDDNYYELPLDITVDTVSHLEVLYPQSGFETPGQLAGVLGVAEPNASVDIAGVPVLVEANGSFAGIVPLFPGTNTFVVHAVDPAGNRASATVTIVQVSGGVSEAQFADLEANLSLATAELSEARSALARLESSQNATAGDLDAARVRVSAAEGNATALQAQLTTANANAASAAARAQKAEDSAGGANLMALLGVALGAGGMAVGSLAFMRTKKKTDIERRAPADSGREK